MDLSILWVVAAGLLEPVWVYSLKRYNASKNILWGLVVLAFMFIGPMMLSMATEGELQVSIAYAVWVGVGMVMTTLLGRFVYHEKIDRMVYVFIAMILVGVVGLDLVVG